MHILREWLLRLWATFKPGRSDRDLEEELRVHLEMSADQARLQGTPGFEARRTAAIGLGGLESAMESVRDQRGLPWLFDLGRDLRYGLRGLIREPVFSIVAVASLALGIGANAAILAIVEAVVLRALPVRDPSQLVFLEAFGSEGPGGAPPYPCFERFRRESSAFDGLAAFATDHLPIEVDGSAEQVFGQIASDNYFDLLGVGPAAGRLMRVGDERLDPPVAVIGYGYWQRRFGGDPAAIGRVVTFRHQPYTIIGVTARSFQGLEPGRRVDVTLPITVERQFMANADDWWLQAIGRLRQGMTSDQAAVQIDDIFQSYMKDRDTSGLRSRRFASMHTPAASRGMRTVRARFAAPLYALTAVAGLVLLIACANVGSLLLVRGAARSREFAIRLAIGAGSGRLFRQLLTETGLLFLCSAAAGLTITPAAISALTRLFAVGRNPILLDVSLNWRLTGAAALMALAAGLAAGLWPALRASRTDPQATLRDGENRLAGSRRLASTARTLVVVQVAIALILLVNAVVFGRTMANLRAVDLGFTESGVLTMSLQSMLTDAHSSRDEQFRADVLDGVRALPGVRAASLSVLTPLSGRDSNAGIDVPGFDAMDPAERIVHVNQVSEGYFETFGIDVIRGRAFTRGDAAAAARVVVINEAAAKAYFGERSPIGSRVRLRKSEPYEIVGVVRDTKHLSVREASARFAFVPLWQPLSGISRITLSAAAGRISPALVRAITGAVRSRDAHMLISDVVAVEDQVNATLLSERIVSMLALAFAALAVGLAAIGVYGVLSHSVAQRRAELGIRSALGARRGWLAFSILRQMLVEVALGVLIGLPLSMRAVRAVADLAFGTGPGDARPYLLSVALLAIGVAAAAVWPIRRAWSIDPAETLRRG